MSLVYGINPVLETLKAGSGSIERICIQKDQRNPRVQEIVELSRKLHLPLSFEERAWLDRKAGRERHQGVLCYVTEARTLDAEEIIESASVPGLFIVLDGIEDPHNVGAILRSAEVAGADGVFLPQRRSAGLGPTVVKSSAGAASHLKIGRVPNVARLIELMKDRGYWIAGLDAESGRHLWEADFSVPTAIVLGHEGSGLHRLVKEKCDFLLSIPVRGKISSHNVSVAAGIALYEVIRQRSVSEKR
jgi:23S rRNA (guanosine2251-2'-O)-methyltransferase